MRLFIYCVLAWVVFPGDLFGKTNILLKNPVLKLDETLKKPSYPEIEKASAVSSKELEFMFKESPLEQFYSYAENIFWKLERFSQDFTPAEKLRNQLWIIYYITAAPYLKTHGGRHYSDYGARLKALEFMDGFDQGEVAKVVPGNAKEFVDLTAVYYAKILSSFRENYDPKFEGKKEAAIKRVKAENPELMKDDVKRIIFYSKLEIAEKRNEAAKKAMDSTEPKFVALLVNYFPGNADEIKKIIKLAGYAEGEIGGLLERALGTSSKDPKYEFLFKAFGNGVKTIETSNTKALLENAAEKLEEN